MKITDQLRSFWNDRARSAATDAERVDSKRRAQRMRFEAFVRCHDLAGASVLDIGCGVGDFYGHLTDLRVSCDYTGVDLSTEMVARAREKYPGARFAAADVLGWAEEERFDVTVAFAIHNVKFPGSRQMLEQLTRKQFVLCRRAAHLSLLTDRYPGFAPHIQPWRAEEILTLALSVSPWVMLRHDYLPNDFSVTMYRKPYIETQPGLLLE